MPPKGSKILPEIKSNKPKKLKPKGCISCHTPKPKTLGIVNKKVVETVIITAFSLDIFIESIIVDIIASNRPIIEVNPAINTRKKNTPPKNIPKGTSLNNEAIVTNNSPGPALGSMSKANNAGNITNPAKIAIAVSKNTTIPTLPGISLFLGSR